MRAHNWNGNASLQQTFALLGLVVLASTALAGCFGGNNPPGDAEVTLNGAGATFPAPLYDKWQAAYSTTVNPKVHINYNAVGSGAGITQITARQVEFGASDAPMSGAEFANASGIVHVPTTLGAVVVIYNIPGIPWRINFTVDTLSRIFNGNITDWNDVDLVALNPGLASVTHNLTLVHRSDGSGTTFVFTSYLRKADPSNWTTSGSKNWPNTLGIGGNGNSGVSSAVQQNTFSVGYVELSFASTSSTPLVYGKVRNRDGSFVLPDTNTTAAAAASLSSLPAGDASWTGTEILNQPGANAYPISSMTYILLYKTQTDHNKGKALVDLLWWAVHDGQQYCAPNGYAPLPSSVVAHNEASLRLIKDASGNQLHP